MKKFEDFIEIIDQELEKRRHKWTLDAIAWMDYQDVSQIIRLHIFKKWSLYNQTEPFLPWVNRVITNQIRNLIRNHYGNFRRPCLTCAAAESDTHCAIYINQCSACPLYAEWEKRKKSAHDTKLPLCLDNHAQEVFDIVEERVDIEKATFNLHEAMRNILKALEWKIYKCLYIDHKSEDEALELMNMYCDKNSRIRELNNVKKSLFEKAEKMSKEIDYY